ncbi:hypothetical protein [Streptomyces venezuelae]|uniref:hypothetical protein n=1 Tax=Streptomyces venezuelae TaxID=54571 RepID=UPI0034187858
MPDQTMPTPPTAPAASEPTSPAAGPAKAIGWGCLGVLLIPLTLLGWLAWNSRGSTDYPRVAPEKLADRAFERSQEAYDVLGFTRRVRPGVEDPGVSAQNTYSSSFCHDDGLFGVEDKVVEGAYRMSHSWALDHVTEAQAVPGLRRLHQRLKDDGWKVSSYREGGKSRMWDLFVQRDDGSERMSFTWFPDRGYFTGGASVPCAYDPAFEEGREEGSVVPAGEREVPPVFGPRKPTR